MPITINGTGTVAGITAGGLPDGCVATSDIADDAVTDAKLSLAANAGEIKKAINADNSPPIYACRAWVNFNGTRNSTNTGASANGGNVLIRASGNVSSVLKNGVGDYTINFTTAMPDANFVGHISGSAPYNTNHVIPFLGVPGLNDTSSHPNASSFRFAFYEPTNSSRTGDPVMVNVAIFR
jgi:hypothetical protein